MDVNRVDRRERGLEFTENNIYERENIPDEALLGAPSEECQ